MSLQHWTASFAHTERGGSEATEWSIDTNRGGIKTHQTMEGKDMVPGGETKPSKHSSQHLHFLFKGSVCHPTSSKPTNSDITAGFYLSIVTPVNCCYFGGGHV